MSMRIGVCGGVLAAAVAGLLIGSALVDRPAAAAGTTYYVNATDGSDSNSGTDSDAPWQSLAKVNGFDFQPGDTIAFAKNESWTGTLKLSASGTASDPITVTSYGAGPKPVIGGDVTDCVAVTGDYWVITELDASGCNWAGFELDGGSHNVLDSVQADNNVAGVSITDTATDNTVRWSTLVDNDKMSVNDKYPTDNDSGAFGVLINGDHNTVSRNTISGSFATSYDYGYDGAAVEIYDGDQNTIEYNVTADNETFTELGHESGATASGNVFAYNSVTSTEPRGSFLVTRGAGSGLGPVTGTLVYNNSVYLPQTGTDDDGQPNSQGWVCDAGCTPDILTLRNNVFSVAGKPGYEDGTGADEDYDVYDNTYAGTQWQFDPGAHSVLADPAFASTGDTPDLHLTAGSPAIGLGVPLGYRYDLDGDPVPADAPDAGAYQH